MASLSRQSRHEILRRAILATPSKPGSASRVQWLKRPIEMDRLDEKQFTSFRGAPKPVPRASMSCKQRHQENCLR